MHVLIKDEGFLADDLAGVGFVPFAQISAQTYHLTLPNTANPEDIAPFFAQLKTIRIVFDTFSDGRGFSLARQLRMSGYSGRLRACGQVLPDQYPHARRCGFDELRIDPPRASRQIAQDWQAAPDWHRAGYQDILLQAGG